MHSRDVTQVVVQQQPVQVDPAGPQAPQGYAQPQGPPQGYSQAQGPPQGETISCTTWFPATASATTSYIQPIQWMPAPTQALANCPPGLEYLTQVDQILVHQQVELWEVTTGYQTANRYIVKNTLVTADIFRGRRKHSLLSAMLRNKPTFHIGYP